MKIDEKEFDRNIKTFGDVIRHMTNLELALFLDQMGANVELGVLAVMRAKMYPHREDGDSAVERNSYSEMYKFMQHRIKNEESDYGDVWGIENWHDLLQWEWQSRKNFGMDVVY